MGQLKGASLMEAIVAAIIFMSVFSIAMELLPRLQLRDDDALLVAEAQYRVGRAFDKYATGVWPAGEYAEKYDWGEIIISVAPYRDFTDMQCITVVAEIDGSCKRIAHKQTVECQF